MSNKFLTRLLAVVMSVSLVIQPVTAFATEPAEGEINDPVLEEVQTFTLGADAAQLMEVQNEDPKPEPIPEPVPAKPLPALQNVKLEGDILSWDLDENSDMYIVQVGDNGDIFDQPSVNLADFCANFNYSSGTYPVTIEGNDLDMNSTTQKYETTYTYAPNITPPENKVIKTVSVNTPYASGIQEGQYVYSYSLASFDVPEVDLYFVDWYKIGDDGSLNAFRESVLHQEHILLKYQSMLIICIERPMYLRTIASL